MTTPNECEDVVLVYPRQMKQRGLKLPISSRDIKSSDEEARGNNHGLSD